MKENLPLSKAHASCSRETGDGLCAEPHAPSSTRELLLRAQAGSREACLALTLQYRPLLESSLAHFGSPDMTDQERRDLREEAERAFLSAISSYDTRQEAVDFGLYAKICLRNGLVSEWRHLQALRRLPVAPEPIEEKHAPDLTVPGPAREVEEEERFSQLCRRIRGLLSEFENRVWWRFVRGSSVGDIARELGCEKRAVHNAIYRIRKKLREELAPPGS